MAKEECDEFPCCAIVWFWVADTVIGCVMKFVGMRLHQMEVLAIGVQRLFSLGVVDGAKRQGIALDHGMSAQPLLEVKDWVFVIALTRQSVCNAQKIMCPMILVLNKLQEKQKDNSSFDAYRRFFPIGRLLKKSCEAVSCRWCGRAKIAEPRSGQLINAMAFDDILALSKSALICVHWYVWARTARRCLCVAGESFTCSCMSDADDGMQEICWQR